MEGGGVGSGDGERRVNCKKKFTPGALLDITQEYRDARYSGPPRGCAACGAHTPEQAWEGLMTCSDGRAQGVRILVVDDDAIILDLFREILSLDGYAVRATRDPLEALTLIESTSYALVITNYRMPGMTGEEFRRRALGARPGLDGRFVFTSGELNRASEQRITEETGARIIAKPFRVDDVRELIASLVGGTGD